MKKTWAEASKRVGRNDLPAVLVQGALIDRVFTKQEIAKGIASAWVSCEWPGRTLSEEIWKILFDQGAGFGFYVNDEGQVRSVTELPETITLYRGAVPTHRKGMSWSTDRNQAEWFAHRFESIHPGKFYTFEASRELVLATFDRRGEAEYVIDISNVSSRSIKLEEEVSV